MAKSRTRIKTNGYNPPSNNPISNENKIVKMKTSLGESYEVFPVGVTILTGVANKVKANYEAEGKDINPPTIKLPSAPGASPVEFSLDSKEACLVEGDEEETKRRFSLFTAYKEILRVYNIDVEQATQRVLFIYGLCKIPGRTRGIDPTLDDEWVQFSANFMEIPKDRQDFLYWYVSERILPTPDDKWSLAWYVNVVNGTAGLVDSSVVHQKVAEMMPAFRNQLGESLQKMDFSTSIERVWKEKSIV